MVVTTLEERIDIYESYKKGEASWRTKRRIRWSRRTIQKWRRRGREQGRAGLHSEMGRPRSGALGSFAPEIGETLSVWRSKNPGWGPSTLVTELELCEALEGKKLPSRATIARFLSEEGFIKEKELVVALPQSEKVDAASAHEVWELDARGYERVDNVGVIAIRDRLSETKGCQMGKGERSKSGILSRMRLITPKS